MKKLILMILMLVCLAFTAAAAGNIEVVSMTPVSNGLAYALSEPDSRVVFDLTLKNLDSVQTNSIADIKISFGSDFTNVFDSTSKFAKPQEFHILNLKGQETRIVQVVVNVPENQFAANYFAVLNIVDISNAGNNGKVDVFVDVQSKAKAKVLEAKQTYFIESGDDNTKTITIKNTGNVDLTNVELFSSYKDNIEEDSDNNELTIKFTPVKFDLAKGAEQSVKVLVDVEKGFEEGTYTPVISAKSTQLADLGIKYSIEIQVSPLICVEGPKGTYLDIAFKNPKSRDEFKGGEDITLNVNIDNSHNKNVKVKVKAVLYNTANGKVVDTATKTDTINDKGDKDIKMTLTMDSTPDSDDDYRIYVKVYKYGAEDEQCAIDDMGINVLEVEDEIKIESFTISPVTAKCGETIDAMVIVKNTGTNDQDDVFIKIENSALRVTGKQTSLFKLDGINNDKVDAQTERFSFRIPDDAKDGTYAIKAIVDYSNGLITDATQTLYVECAPKTQPASNTADANVATGGATANIQTKSFWDKIELESVPMSVWIITDVVLLALFVIALIFALRRRR